MATVLAGLALTLFLNAIDPAYPSRALHVGKDTACALVLILVAALLTGRLRRGRRRLDLLALAAVVVLAFENLLLAVLTAVLPETSGPVTTWVSTSAGVLGAGLLAGAALAPERRLRDPGRALALTAAACVAVLALCVAVAAFADVPPAFSEQPETAAELQRLSQSPGLIVAALVTAALFLAAGSRSRAGPTARPTSSCCGSARARSSPPPPTSTTRCCRRRSRTSSTSATSSTRRSRSSGAWARSP